jgi:hypothetical protein
MVILEVAVAHANHFWTVADAKTRLSDPYGTRSRDPEGIDANVAAYRLNFAL